MQGWFWFDTFDLWLPGKSNMGKSEELITCINNQRPVSQIFPGGIHTKFHQRPVSQIFPGGIHTKFHKNQIGSSSLIVYILKVGEPTNELYELSDLDSQDDYLKLNGLI